MTHRHTYTCSGYSLSVLCPARAMVFPEDTAGTRWWMAGGRWPCRAQGDDRAPARDVKDPEETLNMRLMGEVSQRTQEHSV